MPADTANVQSDLADWTAPIIADRIGEYYAMVLESAGVAYEDEGLKVARRHCRMWVCLLRGRDVEARACRRDLLRMGRAFGLTPERIDAIDRAVIDELMDVVIGRFGRSRGVAHAYGMTLVEAAASLAQVRLAA